MQNSGQKVTVYPVVELFNEQFTHAMTPKNTSTVLSLIETNTLKMTLCVVVLLNTQIRIKRTSLYKYLRKEPQPTSMLERVHLMKRIWKSHNHY